MKIGIDTMGGDFAPLEAIKGVKEYLSETTHAAHIVLFGDEQKLNVIISDTHLPKDSYTIVHATEVIGMHEHPTKALRAKQQSSIAVGFAVLSVGKTDAFMSSRNTGSRCSG